MTIKKTPHVHAEWIKAVADGYEIQYRKIKCTAGAWRDAASANDALDNMTCKGSAELEFRIKPQAPETRMTPGEIEDACGLAGVVQADAALNRFRAVANAAIARAIADGDVVLPGDRAERDMAVAMAVKDFFMESPGNASTTSYNLHDIIAGLK